MVTVMKTAVLISCFDWYKSRLQPIKSELERNQYKVIVLLSDFIHAKKTKITDKFPECTYIPTKPYKKNVSVGRLLSHFLFARDVMKRLDMVHPDLVYALVPPNSVADVCRKYKLKNPDAKLILDLIDMWPESMPGEKLHNTMPFIFWKKIRDDSLMEADHIFTECTLYQEKLDSVLRDKCSTLFLYKEDGALFQNVIRRENKRECKEGKQIVKLCYLGSINHIIDIDGICNVVEHLNKKYAVDVRIIGKGESQDAFIDSLRKTGAEINYYGAIYDEAEKFRILSECDFALNMMVESVSVGLTIKSIDYLSYGLPLINNIKGDTWKLVEAENIGFNVKKGESIELLPEIDHGYVNTIYRKYFTKDAFMKSFSAGFKQIYNNGKDEI